MTNRINPNPNYYSLAAKKRQKEVEERMALLNKIKEDADKHNMSYGKYKENYILACNIRNTGHYNSIIIIFYF